MTAATLKAPVNLLDSAARTNANVAEVNVWWSFIANRWCFEALDKNGGHVISGPAFWCGLTSLVVWENDPKVAARLILQDAQARYPNAKVEIKK
jgi:hypothetical protein